jgi:hypothetical protein
VLSDVAVAVVVVDGVEKVVVVSEREGGGIVVIDMVVDVDVT